MTAKHGSLWLSLGMGLVGWVGDMLYLALAGYQEPWTFFAYPLLVAIGFFALCSIALNIPEVRAEIAEANYKRRELNHRADHLDDHPKDEPPKPDPNGELWRAWTVRHLEAIRDGKYEGPKYSKGMDTVMQYQLWTVFVYILKELQLIEPVIDRQRTVFRKGVSAASAALAVRAAKTIPLPREVADQKPPIAEQEKHE